MEQTKFAKLLRASFRDQGSWVLLYKTKICDLERTYQVPNVATQLAYQALVVFNVLSNLGLQFFLVVNTWGILPKVL